jgi:hypothetical protein
MAMEFTALREDKFGETAASTNRWLQRGSNGGRDRPNAHDGRLRNHPPDRFKEVDPAGPTIFAAVEQQLGLRLVPR